jgi:hypothetical protein
VVVAIAQAYMQKGDWENALAYMEWYEHILPPYGHPSMMSIVEELRVLVARRRHETKGEE